MTLTMPVPPAGQPSPTTAQTARAHRIPPMVAAPMVAAFAGDIAADAFNAATPDEQRSLAEWIDLLATSSDAQFVAAAADAISRSALDDVWEQRTQAHTCCKILLAHREAYCRHLAEGHAFVCPGPTLYDQAWARVAQQNGVTDDPPLPACTCTFVNLPAPSAPLTRMWK